MRKPLFFFLFIIFFIRKIAHSSQDISNYFIIDCGNSSSTIVNLSPTQNYYVSNANFTICNNFTIGSSSPSSMISLTFDTVILNISQNSSMNFINCSLSFEYSPNYLGSPIFFVNSFSSVSLKVHIFFKFLFIFI